MSEAKLSQNPPTPDHGHRLSSVRWPYFALIGAAIAVIVIFMVLSKKDVRQEGPIVTTPPPEASTTATVSASPRKTGSPANSVIAGMNYSDTLKLYENKRFQFNKQCQSKPTTMTIKKGGSLMLDNRSDESKVISVDGKKYTLAAFGFQVISPTSTTLPHTTQVDCGLARNVAQVLIQR